MREAWNKVLGEMKEGDEHFETRYAMLFRQGVTFRMYSRSRCGDARLARQGSAVHSRIVGDGRRA